MNKAKILRMIIVPTLIVALTAGITYAAFGDRGQVLGSKFTVGSADIKLLLNVNNGTDTSNLSDELPGPEFNNIVPNWASEYKIKIFNNGTTNVKLLSNSNYLTVNDPEDLRSIIYVEPFLWNDDGDGIVETGEMGESFGRKTITKWKTEGYDLGAIASGAIKSLVLKFSTDTVSETKQGKTGLFDFVFDSESL